MHTKTRRLLISAALIFLTCASALHLWRIRTGRSHPGAVEQIAATLATPVWMVGELVCRPIIWLRTIVHTYHNTQDLQQKYQQLLAQCEQLQAEVTSLRASELHAELTGPLHLYTERYDAAQHHIARIILRTMEPHQHSIIINKGTRHGVSTGAVAVYHNQLLGIVTTASPWTAIVRLINDSASTIAVTTHPSGNTGIAQGTGTPNQLLLRFASSLVPLAPGDYVFSSGTSTLVPEGFALGTLTEITSDGVCYEAHITPTLDLQTIRYCIILDRSKIDLY